MNSIFGKVLWRIRPQQRLLDLLPRLSKSEADELALVEIWCTNATRLPLRSAEQESQRIKILYLLRVAKFYGHLDPLREALRLPGVSVATFDELWALELLGGIDADADD